MKPSREADERLALLHNGQIPIWGRPSNISHENDCRKGLTT